MDHLDQLVDLLAVPLTHFFQPGSRSFVAYLATSLVVALIIHFRESSKLHSLNRPLQKILPAAVYTHHSAKVDYLYFITNSILYSVIMVPFVGLGGTVSGLVQSVLDSFMTPSVMVGLSPLSATLFFSLIYALVADFGTFFSHYLSHRIPLLWEFHKVHHSAEVLTPITVYRMHPLDDVITMIVIGLLTGVTDGIARFFITPEISIYTVYGLGIASFLFFLTGYHLRHSHVWLSYGPVLSKILISPAQHQIHHSKAPHHWNKNYGFIFATWDWLFGSLYVPKQREDIEFGIGNGEEHLYSSALKLYILPFKKAIDVIKKKRPHQT